MKDEMKQYKGRYDYKKIEEYLVQRKDKVFHDVESKLQENDLEGGIALLDSHIKASHKVSTEPVVDNIEMERANSAFDAYLRTLEEDVTEVVIQEALERYKTARKAITAGILKMDAKYWDDVIKVNDSKRFWSYVDWKGNLKHKKNLKSPSLQEFEVFFEHLYKCDNQYELRDIMSLESNVNIPVLDDPIHENEVHNAVKSMKKSGFDYNLPILTILITSFMSLMLNILNMMFYVTYPIALACSLLSIIPKKGNLLLLKNYRGVQMMKAIACLYDRIIANRLKLWLPFHVDQTAFQKGKSTLLHIFTIRIIIEIAKKKNLTIYI